jgi:translocation and assembly module TamB
VNRGDISFANPFRIEPVLNLDLETRVSGYDILLTLIGPLQRLNVTYRSDPPLTFNELVTLLAVGRAPTVDPTLTAQQTSQARALSQIGADTIIGEAITRPVTGRLQRFFGVSRLKLDPELVGPEGTATARVTIEQQVGRDVTFTYTYNLASAQEQIIRVRWAISREWSLEAVRDQNGLVGLDILYKKRFR